MYKFKLKLKLNFICKNVLRDLRDDPKKLRADFSIEIFRMNSSSVCRQAYSDRETKVDVQTSRPKNKGRTYGGHGGPVPQWLHNSTQ